MNNHPCSVCTSEPVCVCVFARYSVWCRSRACESRDRHLSPWLIWLMSGSLKSLKMLECECSVLFQCVWTITGWLIATASLVVRFSCPDCFSRLTLMSQEIKLHISLNHRLPQMTDIPSENKGATWALNSCMGQRRCHRSSTGDICSKFDVGTPTTWLLKVEPAYFVDISWRFWQMYLAESPKERF